MPAATRLVAGSTPASLKRLIVMVLAGTVLLWLTATTLQRSLQSTAESVRGSASPAYLDAVQARAALSDADRAAWQSFRSGAAQLTGPGQQYQNDLTNASQALQRLAALEPPGSADSMRLQTISGQLVTYQGLVEQADAAYRADIALGAGSKGELGLAYLTYASSALRDPQGGLLASIDQLAGPISRHSAASWRRYGRIPCCWSLSRSRLSLPWPASPPRKPFCGAGSGVP